MSSPRKRGPITTELCQKIGSIAPIQVLAFDKPNFPVSIPFLQLLLAADCIFRRLIFFKMHEAMNSVLLDEFRSVAGTMHLQSAADAVGYADIQRSVFSARKNVDVIQVKFPVMCGIIQRLFRSWK